MTKQRSDIGVCSGLWVNGRHMNSTMIWVSESHAELVVEDYLSFYDGQLIAFVVRGFLSLPARVEVQTGRHIVLRFEQRPHSSVIEVLRSDLLEAGIAAARDAAEEAALSLTPYLELAVWDQDGDEANDPLPAQKAA